MTPAPDPRGEAEHLDHPLPLCQRRSPSTLDLAEVLLRHAEHRRERRLAQTRRKPVGAKHGTVVIVRRRCYVAVREPLIGDLLSDNRDWGAVGHMTHRRPPACTCSAFVRNARTHSGAPCHAVYTRLRNVGPT